MDKVLETIMCGEKVKVILFGFSRPGRNFCDGLPASMYDRIYFCDNSVNKIGKDYKNIPVLSVAESLQLSGDKKYVICSLFHQESMKEQLLKAGIREEQICALPSELIKEERERLRTEKYVPKKRLQFEVDIAMHCNLKCKSCHHFSPLAEKEVTDFSIFKKDFGRLKELFGEAVDRIYLLGGEPLLNSDVAVYMQTAREHFENAEIELISNGLLLPKMDFAFWDTCRKYKIKISVTKYPIPVDYVKLEKLCTEQKVEFSFFGSAVEDKHMSYYPLDLSGMQDMETNFYTCNMASNCVTLKRGKLYPCVLPPNIVHFNTFFEKKLEVDEKDGIDIYEAQSKEEVMNFLSKPIPFCRYCAVCRRTYDNPWEYSQLKIEEWI